MGTTPAHPRQIHWSRWGDPDKAQPLPEKMRTLLETAFGSLDDNDPVALDEVRLPEPGLAADLVDELRDIVGGDHVRLDQESRVRHTRGKSTPDLLKIRAGDGADAPDAVAQPADADEVTAVVDWCSRRSVAVVPFGGGTSVVGGLASRREGFAGVLALDLRRLNQLVAVDAESQTATLEAGLLGPEAEALLAERGLTLGHFPQSYEYASIGGFAATRSSGQASAGYGRFNDLVVGVRMVTPIGVLDLGRAPASAAGPDLRQLVLGSEGALGVITSVTVRVQPKPAVTVYEAWRFPSFQQGVTALRQTAQRGLRPAVLRLSDEMETGVNMAQPGADDGESGGCQLIVGYEGQSTGEVDAVRSPLTSLYTELDGTALGEQQGAAWAGARFAGPYLRDGLLDVGMLAETLETATCWSNLNRLYDAVRAALTKALSEKTLVLCHISHVYPTGASLYFTVVTKQSEQPLEQWASAKTAAGQAIMDTGGTITHHHAVGRDHRPWLEEEIGAVGVEILRAIKQRLDPAGVLNPEILIP